MFPSWAEMSGPLYSSKSQLLGISHMGGVRTWAGSSLELRASLKELTTEGCLPSTPSRWNSGSSDEGGSGRCTPVSTAWGKHSRALTAEFLQVGVIFLTSLYPEVLSIGSCK